MPLHFISAENIRKPLIGILDSIIQLHISHRLNDDFLILTPDLTCSEDIQDLLLRDSRLGNILIGESILTLEKYIEKCSNEIYPNTRKSPEYIQEALFNHVLQSKLHPQYSDLSQESLYLLIKSFRDEFLSPNNLFLFLESFDPELAQQCVSCFEEYDQQIQKNSYLKDLVWQANSVFKNHSLRKIRNLKNIKRIYYLGFIHFTPLLKRSLQALDNSYPEIEQLVLIQKPKGIESQDYFSKYWGEIPKNLSEFKNTSDNKKITCIEYAGSFDECSDILKQIEKLIQAGSSASSLSLLLPQDEFLRNYLEKQLFEMGLHPYSHKKRYLDQIPLLQKSFSLPIQQAFEFTQNTLLEKRSKLSSQTASLLAEDIHALECWKENLEEILFYQEEYPEIMTRLPALKQIAQQEILSTPRQLHEGIQVRSANQAGLKEFSQSFILQVTEDVIPQNPERFFALNLPATSRQLVYQRALFQNLTNSGNEVRISYPKIGFQGREKSPSPFLASLPLKTENKIAKISWYSKILNPEIQEQVETEIKRQNDLSYRHSHGAYIQNKNILQKLRNWMENKVFSASRLEKYASCPFTFFANSLLGIEMEEEKTLEGDAREQGKWVHQILESFFSQHLDLLKKAGKEKKLREEIFQILASKIQEQSSMFLKEKQWVHPHLFGDFSQRVIKSCQELLDLFWKQWDEGKAKMIFIPRFFEKEFGNETPFVFRKASLPPLKLKGRIDRIDMSEDGKQFITWDYKTGNLQGFSSEVKEFKKLQIPLYLLAAQRMKGLENLEPIASLALGLQEMNYNQGIALKEKAKSIGLNGRSSSLLSEDAWESFWNNFEIKLMDYFENIYLGDFRTMPDPCSEFCEYKNICRYHDRKKA